MRLISDQIRDMTSKCLRFNYIPASGTQRKWTYFVGEQEVLVIDAGTVGAVIGVYWASGRSLDAEYAHAEWLEAPLIVE